MASSGSLNTSAYSGRYLQFSWTESSQNIANNTTTISWTLKGAGGGTSYYLTQNIKVTIDGETVYDHPKSKGQIKLGNGTTVTSGTYTFAHKEDGTRTFKVYVEAGIYVWAVNCTGSETFTLDTIARASQPSCITYPDHTQDVGEFGDEISIHMNRKSSAFTHTVRYQFGDQSGTIATNVETGVKWVIPLSLMNLIPSVTSGSGTIYVDTYNGSTKVGTKYCGFTAKVPASVKPSCSFVLDDITGVDTIYGSPVKGLSKIKVTVSSTAAYSSPVTSCVITANGVRYTSSPATTGILATAGKSTVTATVTDMRGRSGSASYDMSVQDYNAPSVTALSVHRCNEDGTANDRGEYVKVTFSSSVSSMNSKNNATYKLRYKKSSVSSFTPVSLSELVNNFAVKDYEYIFAADSSSSYDVEVEISDRHNTVARSTSASTAFTLINFHPDGTGIRFGGVAEEKDTFQNDLAFVQTKNQYSFSSVGAASTDGYILMARITVTATNADTPLTFVFSQRKATAPMTVHILFKSTADTDPGLESIVYEGDNYGAYLTKTSSSVWDLYVKKVSNSDTVTLNRWHTSYRQMKRVSVEFVGSIVATVPTGMEGYYRATPFVSRSIIDFVMPVGFILTLYSHADPNEMYPGTTWERIENVFLWASASNGIIGQTGGEKEHTLTTAELPKHTHGSVYSGNVNSTKTHAWLASGGSAMAYGTVEAGGGESHNNMPPYIQVSVWRRTA